MRKAAVFNDLSGFGKCSLTVALPVLSVMGVQCCPIPTAVLTSQSGYDTYYVKDLTEMIPNYTKAWLTNGESFDAIYSGYTTGARQISLFMDFIDTFYGKSTILLVDPVMGDDGHTYKMFHEELKLRMIELASRADIITPNLTEACLLAGIPISTIADCKEADDFFSLAAEAGKKILLHTDKDQEIIITGIKCKSGNNPVIYNQLIGNHETYRFGTPFTDKSFSGTGDLMASIICGYKLNGLSTRDSMEKAVNFIRTCITDTMAESIPEREGVNFEKYLYTLASKP